VNKASSDQPTFSAACVQFNVRRGDVDHNRKKAIAGIKAAAAVGAELVVLPELWPTSFVAEAPDALLEASERAEVAVRTLARELNMVIVGGGLERAEGKLFDRAQVIDRGEILGSYRKIHLFSPNAEDRYLAAGDRPVIADTSLGRIGVVICYDLRFPELVRYYFYKNVGLLAVPSQWPEARTTHWRTMLKARAIENEMFIVGCNRTGVENSLKNDEKLHYPGDSRIIDPMGATLGSGAGEDGPVIGEIELRKVRSMRRILPIRRDRRPDIYAKIWRASWEGDDA